LNPSGPYILYGGEGGIWISNPDGSFLTKITDLPIDLDDLHRAISPRGDRMALIVSNDTGLDLVEVKIPGGETKTIAHLLSITHDELISYPTNMKSFAAYAIRDYDNVAWQPEEGQLLAFMGGMNGPTSDLYVYDTESGEITQLTSGLSQGVFPNWSPDGKYILHYGIS
jgi:Tol biopolymer transport system component